MQPDASPTTNRFARFVSGRTSKWLILGFWVVILAVAFSPANKLTGAQENDAVAWLPGDAESTIVLHEMERFQSSDETPAVIVYERPGGATTEDIAAVAGQVKQFDDVEHVTRDSVGPLPSKDQQALQVIVPIDAGHRRLDRDRHHGRRAAEDHRVDAPTGCRCTSPAPVATPPTRRPPSTASTASCCYSAVARGDRDPADHLPQPAAVDPAGVLRGGVACSSPRR